MKLNRLILIFIFLLTSSLSPNITFNPPVLGIGITSGRDSMFGSSNQDNFLSIPSPKIGGYNVLVLFLEFSNYNNLTSISSILSNVSAVNQYYNEVSYNEFWLSIWYLNQWITLNRTREYYGQDSGNQVDVNWQDFMYDSLGAADSYVNYGDYDYVLLVHAGNDQASSGDPDDLWSKASLGKWYFSYDGGVNLGITIVAETDPVGVIAHELGHNLELPDLYDYNKQEVFVGEWSLMSSGSWLSPPASLMAPEKMWLGWIDTENITIVNQDEIVSVQISPLENLGSILAVKIPVSGVYYIVEYRRRTGTDDALPSEGIIISMINESKPSGGGVIKVIDGSPSTPTLGDAAFGAGERYVNLIDDFYVKVISITNNYAVVEVEKGIPDLYIANLTLYRSGNKYLVTLEIRNGGGPTLQFDTSLYIDGLLAGVKNYSSLLPRNGGVEITFDVGYLASGSHTFYAVVDPDDDVIERNENNNVYSGSISIQTYSYALDKYLVSDDRADIGSIQYVWMHFINYSSGLDYSNKPVEVNGTLYLTNASGWIETIITSNDATIYRFIVTDSDAAQYVTPQIIFDRVIVNISFIDRRIDVGSAATPQINAYYEYDSSQFNGQVILNNSLIQNVVGIYWFGVAQVIDPQYGLTVYTGNSDYVIYDRIVVELTDSDGRVDIGSDAKDVIYLYYEYDSTPFKGVYSLNDTTVKNVVGRYGFKVVSINDNKYGLTVFVGGEFQIIFDKVHIELWALRDRYPAGYKADIGVYAYYVFDGSAFEGDIILNDTLTKDVPGIYAYSVERIVDGRYGLTVFEAGSIHLIFDRVIIILSVEDARISIGDTANISYEGYYEYDHSPFQGTIMLNDSLTHDTVGRYWYSIVSINDQLYGLTSFKSNSVYVIFDLVNITLSTENDRIDIGSYAQINIYAVYAYGGEIFTGDIIFNDTLIHNAVGLYNYTVAAINDNKYGISAFTSNTVSIIFDEVVIELKPKYTRVMVGREAEITITSYYAYDRKPFEGIIYLNNPLKQPSIGLYTYSVEEIGDNPYGLQRFRSNSVDIIFDKLSLIVNVGTITPFTYNIAVKIYSQYENAYIYGYILINGEQAKPAKPGEMTYVKTFVSPLLTKTINIEAMVEGISLNYHETTLGIGTTSLYVILAALFIIIILLKKAL